MINLHKVWDQAGIELATPGSAVRPASVTRHVTDCATRPGINHSALLLADTREVLVSTFTLYEIQNLLALRCACVATFVFACRVFLGVKGS